MPPIQFRAYVDWDNDGSLTTPPAAGMAFGDDISGWVKDIDIKVGNQDEMSLVAEVGTCTIMVDNSDRYFSAYNPASPVYGKLLPRRRVQVDATDGLQTWTVFVGFVNKITPTAGLRLERTCQIECVDYLGVFQGHYVNLPLLRSFRSDQIIQAIINQALGSPAATNAVNFTGTISDNDTIAIRGTSYRFKTALAAINDVLIGADRYTAYTNLRKAINGEDGSGTLYFTGTAQVDYVKARETESYFKTVKDDAPIRYYRLAETSGVVATDSGANLANGTYSGSPTFSATGAMTGDTNTAVTFDGVNDVVSVPAIDLSARSISIEFWLKPSSTLPPASQIPLIIHNTTVGLGYYQLQITNTSGAWNFFNGTTTLASGTNMTMGSYNHVVVTYDVMATTLRLYLNGAEVANSTSFAAMNLNPTTINLGSALALSWFKGDIDEFAIYTRTLTAARVLAHYNARTVNVGLSLYSLIPGTIGNTFTTTETSAGITIGGATFSGGVDYPAGAFSFDVGNETFDYAGDGWKNDNTNALSAITDVVHSEYGLFRQQPNGVLIFKNRNSRFLTAATVSKGAIANEGLIVGESDVDRVYNRVVVDLTPRSTLSSGVVAKSTSTLDVPGTGGGTSTRGTIVGSTDTSTNSSVDNSREVNLQFVDTGTGNPMSVTSLVLPPAPITDWQAGEVSAGDNGGFYNNFNFLKFFVESNGTSAKVRIENSATGTLKIFGFQIRGVGLVQYDKQTIINEDATSIAAYQRRTLSFSLPLATLFQFGVSLAAYLLSRYKAPQFRVSRIDFQSLLYADGVSLYNLTLGDVIQVSDAQIGLSLAKHEIIGIEQKLGQRNVHERSFVLRRADDTTYALWDDAEIGLWSVANWAM